MADIFQMLSACCKPPTRIATEANLAYDRMAEIVETLMERGLSGKTAACSASPPRVSSSSTPTDSGGGS